MVEETFVYIFTVTLSIKYIKMHKKWFGWRNYFISEKRKISRDIPVGQNISDDEPIVLDRQNIGNDELSINSDGEPMILDQKLVNEF